LLQSLILTKLRVSELKETSRSLSGLYLAAMLP